MRRLFSEDSEALLFKSLNYIPIPVLLSEALDVEGRRPSTHRVYRFMNHAFIEQLGYTMSDIPDIESWFNTVYPDPILRDKAMLEWDSAVYESEKQGLSTAGFQTYLRCGNGEYRWFLITAQITTENQSNLNIVTMRDVHQLQLLIEDNKRQSNTDLLTGLANRRQVERILASAMEHSTDAQGSLCLVMCDIDFFKSINDNFGHLCGDDVLKLVADQLKHYASSASCVARWGGEEFLIVLENTELEIARELAEKLRCDIESTDYQSYGQHMHLTMSFGCVGHQVSESLQSLLFRVDSVLYKAKNDGRNCVVLD